MIVKLNNIDITNKISLEHGYVAKDNFTPDNFDSITYTFYFKEEIEIKVSDILEVDNRQWLIGSIDGSIAMKKPVRYKITILCIELTKILERFIVPPCAFTNKSLWLQTQMLRAIDKAVLRRNDETRKFVFKNPFSNTETNLLYEVMGEDFFFNEMTTLREVLDEMLSIVKHRIEIIEIRDGIITLGARSLIAAYSKLISAGSNWDTVHNKLSNPSDLPTGNSYGVSFSSDGTYLAVVHSVTPYLTVYKRLGDTFTKITGIPALAGQGLSVSFSSDDNYLAVGHYTSPFLTVYKRSGDTFTKITGIPALAGTGFGVSFSSDDNYLAVGHYTSPFLTVYKRSGDTFTKITGIPALAGTGFGVSFSSDDTYLAVAHNGAPYLTVYKRLGDTFTKISGIEALPGDGRGVAFSSDDTYLAVAHYTSPFLTVYKRSGDTFTKITGIPALAGTGFGVSFSSDDTYLAVAHSDSPFLTVYKRSEDTFTKIQGIEALAGTGFGVSFSNDGTYLAVAHSDSPFLTIYKTTIINPTTPEIKTLSNSGLVSKRTIQSYENYAKNYETMVDNVYPANKNIINDAYNLSWENWQTLKPITPEILSTNNAKMVVTFPIEQLLQVKMQWKIVAKLTEKDAFGVITYRDVEYSVEKDITDLFLEEEIYNALPLDEQEKHFSYSKGEKAIGILKTRKVALYFPISEIENQMFLDATVQNLLESQGYTANQSSPDYPKYKIKENYPTGNGILTKTLYWIFYKSYQNYHISISKDGDYDFKGGTVIQNPEATQIDLQRYGNLLEDIAKNKGNKEIHYDYIIKDTSDLLLLGDRVLYDENSIMTLLEREYSIFNNFVKAHYVFAINYAAPINARLNRERRAFINPIKDFIKRDIFIKDKVRLITTKYADDRGLIKRSLLNYAFTNTLDHTETTTEPLDLGVIYTPYGNYQLQMHGSPVGKSIRYHFECLDNYSAGLSIGDTTVGGYAVNLNPYVNSIGELEDIEIDLVRSVLGAASQELTFQQKLDKALAAPLTTRESSAYSNKVKFKIWKDTFEHLTFTYQLEFSAFSSGTVIIGNLAKYIELVNGNKLNGNAYIWVSDEKYYNTENKRCKGIKTAYQPEKDIDKDIINPIPTAELITYEAWAIGTNSGELLVAVNNLKTDKHILSLQIAPDTINI